jgi:hypothetical protein
MEWDLLLCHGRKHYVVEGTNPETSVFVNNDRKTNPDFVLDVFKMKFKPCHIFNRVFVLYCPYNEKLIEHTPFIKSAYNVLKKNGILLLPSAMFEYKRAYKWTREVFNPIIKPYFYTKPIGKYSADEIDTLIMFKSRY